MANGRRFIHSIQRPDGGWYGSWGVCFTYGEPRALHACTYAYICVLSERATSVPERCACRPECLHGETCCALQAGRAVF